MGQRSQIYIRYNVEGHKGLIARYFQWNYGERMVSRARGIIKTIKDEFLQYKFMWGEPQWIVKLERICDVNFDMKDIVLSNDIIKEIEEQWDCDLEYLFAQDNNDGQLLIDVTDDEIKYCFIPYYSDIIPMDGDAYMQWNMGYGKTVDRWDIPTKYMTKEIIAYTKDNIQAISKMAQLMTVEETEEFVTADYDYIFPHPF